MAAGVMKPAEARQANGLVLNGNIGLYEELIQKKGMYELRSHTRLRHT